jgi:hypothetical protein
VKCYFQFKPTRRRRSTLVSVVGRSLPHPARSTRTCAKESTPASFTLHCRLRRPIHFFGRSRLPFDAQALLDFRERIRHNMPDDSLRCQENSLCISGFLKEAAHAEALQGERRVFHSRDHGRGHTAPQSFDVPSLLRRSMLTRGKVSHVSTSARGAPSRCLNAVASSNGGTWISRKGSLAPSGFPFFLFMVSPCVKRFGTDFNAITDQV